MQTTGTSSIVGNVRVAPHPGGYRIEEIVTEAGHYIHWPDLFGSAQSAADELERMGYKKREIEVVDDTDSGS